MLVFGMVLILFGTIFPVATRAGHAGGNYAQATFLAQHKIDQLRNAGAAKLDGISLAGLGLIDRNSNGTPIVNANGSFSFTLTDNLVDNTKNSVFYPGFFPPGSTGTILITNSFAVNGITTTTKLITVTLSWANGSATGATYSTHTAISPS